MVRINLISPDKLADQHLVAEYNEILMLLGYVRKNPWITDAPKDYILGKGHIKFFKNKLIYLKNRHELIKKEMKRRGFAAKKTISLAGFSRELRGDWQPKRPDHEKIKERLRFKIIKKPGFYRYLGEKKENGFFLNLLK